MNSPKASKPISIKPKSNTSKASSRYHHGDLRQGLLNAAAEMIHADGVDAVSMRKLADKVGVSRTALYHHFDGKQDLLCALAEDGFVRQRKLLHEVMLQAAEQEPRQMLEAYVKTYIDFAVKNPAYYGLMFGREIWKSAGANDQLTDVAKRAFKNYVDTIAWWQQQGIVPDNGDPLRFAQVSWGTLHGLSRLMIDGIYIDQLPQQATIDTVVDMFMH